MTDPTDNLVLVMLRDIRGTLDVHSKKLEKLEKLDRDFETFKVQLTYALGLASSASLPSVQTEARVEEIETRQREMRAAFQKLHEEVGRT